MKGIKKIKLGNFFYSYEQFLLNLFDYSQSKNYYSIILNLIAAFILSQDNRIERHLKGVKNTFLNFELRTIHTMVKTRIF